MIPVLYPPWEQEFRTNGIGRLADCLSCTVTEERNGIYEVKMRYPITGQHYQDIKEGCILWVIHDDTKTPQPFDIYARTAPINGVVTFRAHHISYRLGNVILKPFTASSVAAAFALMNAKSATTNNFTFWTDKATVADFSVIEPTSVKAVLGGKEGSILDVYGGGEYEWDKYTVKLYENRGSDSGVEIRYGKNLSDITQELDTSSMYSAVAPFWRSEDEVVMLPEYIVTSNQMPMNTSTMVNENSVDIVNEDDEPLEIVEPIIKAVPLDLSDRFDIKPSFDQLRTAAQKALSHGWVPDENIEVDFVQLWQTEEYENVAPLQRVRLCDTVSVYYPELGVVAEKQKVIKTVYNVLLERFDSMELGRAKTSFAETVMATVESSVLKQVPTKSYMDAAIETATQLIKGGAGGHVVIGTNAEGQPNEIFFMDTDNTQTAVNVLRINMNGIGFSSSGINGTYDTAWTLDGVFNANFINTGVLNANILKAGIIADEAGLNYWNLETGEISITYSEQSTSPVTHADLEGVKTLAQGYASTAESNAKNYTDSELEALDFATEEWVEGQISVSKTGIETEFSNTFSAKGDTTVGIVKWYYKSTSPTQLYGDTWSTLTRTWENGYYIWEKSEYLKGDGSSTFSEAICITGNTGTGAKGKDGAPAYLLYITQNKSSSVPKEATETVTFTAHIQAGDDPDIDQYGTTYNYVWYASKDNGAATQVGTGKTYQATINQSYCNNNALVWFEAEEVT